jgi:N-acetylglucosamine kinase-like BadF-type ATPase
MPNLLLAESGSTKTDWCLIRETGRPVHFKTSGINPYLQTPEMITSLLQDEMGWKTNRHTADAISFYGAGAGSEANQKIIKEVLCRFFSMRKVEVQGDLLAAARASCGDEKGIVCILGTGSNSGYYDGRRIKEQKASLGYIAGDEGSGNHLGKRVLQYYAYNTFDTELRMAFELMFGNDLPAIMHALYREPFPNRTLARMAELLAANRGHFMVENVIEDCLNDFFHHHILKYRQSWKQPLYFTGSVAYFFKDVISDLCSQYELELGGVAQSPLAGLIKYHSRQ